MKVKLKSGEIHSNVDMTPMIDIVFQLILFFLVSTTFVVLPGIKLKLPSSSTADVTNMQGITITADKDGGLFFNDKEVSMTTLGDELNSYDIENGEKNSFPVSLEADEEVTNGTIVKIFDVIRKSGFCVINLRTNTEE